MCKIIISIVIFAFSSIVNAGQPCLYRTTEYGGICVCNSTYCDTLNGPQPNGGYVEYTTSKSGKRFEHTIGKFRLPKANVGILDINAMTTYVKLEGSLIPHPEVTGFGGGLTTAGSYLLDKLPQPLQNHFYRSCFSPAIGSAYSIIHVPIGACSYDFREWAYNELTINDTQLTSFTKLGPEDKRRATQIRKIKIISKNVDVKILAGASTAPRWMKNRYEWGGADNFLQTAYYQTYADYLVRYIELMQNASVPIWALSTGNSPSSSAELNNSLGMPWRPHDQGKFIAENLGPTMASQHPDVELHAFDDNRQHLFEWMYYMATVNITTMNYISMIDVHGDADSQVSAFSLDLTSFTYKEQQILYTENAVGKGSRPKLGCWKSAEELIKKLMENLSHDVTGYLDRNLILNSEGGPSLNGDFSDASIIASDDYTEFYKQPSYYAFAHFSRFVPAASRRIDTINIGPNSLFVQTLAFLQPNGKITVIMYNGDDAKTMPITIVDKIRGKIDIELTPKTIKTVVF